MYVKSLKIKPKCLTPDDSMFSNFVTFRQYVYEKLEKRSLWSFWDRLKKLLVRHAFSDSEMSGLLCHGIVVNVE